MSRCIIPGCTNFSHQGEFDGPICAPCAGALRQHAMGAAVAPHSAAARLLSTRNVLRQEIQNLFVLICPSWATDGTPEHEIRCIKRRLDEWHADRKKVEACGTALRILLPLLKEGSWQQHLRYEVGDDEAEALIPGVNYVADCARAVRKPTLEDLQAEIGRWKGRYKKKCTELREALESKEVPF